MRLQYGQHFVKFVFLILKKLHFQVYSLKHSLGF
jgi:hypothetical protein